MTSSVWLVANDEQEDQRVLAADTDLAKLLRMA